MFAPPLGAKELAEAAAPQLVESEEHQLAAPVSYQLGAAQLPARGLFAQVAKPFARPVVVALDLAPLLVRKASGADQVERKELRLFHLTV